ncbi:alkaline-phosphatase-like protein [Obelidium mucronatum]|nr:alkaline-phosphatase-like protein [Obelidium mucronatum]
MTQGEDIELNPSNSAFIQSKERENRFTSSLGINRKYAVVIGIVLGISVPLGTSEATRKRPLHPQSSKATALTLLIGLDGFREDYLDKTITPALFDFFEKAAVSSLQPVFPAQSFPNQYSMITGLLPAKHGLVGDYFHSTSVNSEYNASYSRNNSYNSVNNPIFYGGVPLWQSVQSSRIYIWNSQARKLESTQSLHHFNAAFNKTQTDLFRAGVVENWIKGVGIDGTTPIVTPAFIATHMRVMDVAGTAMGTDVSRLKANLTALDQSFAKIIAAAQAFKTGPVNIVVVSDHGMSAVDNSKTVYYEDLFDVSTTIIVQNRPMAYLYTNGNFDVQAFSTKAKAFESSLTYYVKGINPAPGFESGGDRIPDILILPVEGVVLAYKTPGYPTVPISGGSAGYLHTIASMQGVFAGQGPAFKSGIKSSGSPVRTVDVYALLVKLIGGGVKSAAGVDSSVDVFNGLLV